jgi:hypothetical protein
MHAFAILFFILSFNLLASGGMGNPSGDISRIEKNKIIDAIQRRREISLLIYPDQLKNKYKSLSAVPCTKNRSRSFYRDVPNYITQHFTIEVENNLHPCENQILLASYNNFLGGLNYIKAEFPSFYNDVIISTQNKINEKFKIKIVSNPKKFNYQGQEILEHSWYNSKSDTIYWNFRHQYTDQIAVFGSRHNGVIIIHEIVHSILKKSLRERYPSAPHWHHFPNFNTPTKENIFR